MCTIWLTDSHLLDLFPFIFILWIICQSCIYSSLRCLQMRGKKNQWMQIKSVSVLMLSVLSPYMWCPTALQRSVICHVLDKEHSCCIMSTVSGWNQQAWAANTHVSHPLADHREYLYAKLYNLHFWIVPMLHSHKNHLFPCLGSPTESLFDGLNGHGGFCTGPKTWKQIPATFLHNVKFFLESFCHKKAWNGRAGHNAFTV